MTKEWDEKVSKCEIWEITKLAEENRSWYGLNTKTWSQKTNEWKQNEQTKKKPKNKIVRDYSNINFLKKR